MTLLLLLLLLLLLVVLQEGLHTAPGVRRFLSVDIRTAALFRVALAIAVIADVNEHWPDRCDFYSDEGLVMRSTFTKDTSLMWTNVHLLSGDCEWTTLIFTAQFALATSMLFGLCPRVCSGVLSFIYNSQHRRNPFAVTGGDALLRIMCLWGALMPLGASTSLDRILWPSWTDVHSNITAPEAVMLFDMGTLGAKLQVTVIADQWNALLP